MKFTRRDLLKFSSVGIVAGLAGCGEDAEVVTENQDDNSGNEDGQNGNSDNSQNPDQQTDQQSTTFEFGETAVYTSGDASELAITPTQAQLRDSLIYTTSNSVFSEVPDSSEQAYLTIQVEAENRGSESVRTPSSVVFTHDGSQYDVTYTQKYSNSTFVNYSEIQPGAATTGWVVFMIQPNDSEGRLIAEFTAFEDAPVAEWTVDVGGLDQITRDYSGLSAGETATIGTGTTQYSTTAVSAAETQSYTYGSGQFDYEQTPAEGNKYVFVTVRAENTGQSMVRVPTTYDLSLISGSSQYSSGLYRGDQTVYEGGEISPGITREGIIQFEVPESASSYQLQANLTREISAMWDL